MKSPERQYGCRIELLARLLLCALVCAAPLAMAATCPDVKPIEAATQADAPLHDAIHRNDVRAVNRLLDSGHVNERDVFGNTALIAALTPNASLEQQGTANGKKARRRIETENKARQAMVSALLSQQVPVNETGAQGRTALMQVAAFGYSSVADVQLGERLLGLGAAVNAQDDFGSTALMLAARRGKIDLAKLLLSKGADTRLRNCHDESASSLAGLSGYPELAALLSH